MERHDAPAAPFALYLHWPFCQSKCPYCDFNSHVAATVNQSDWTQAFVQEIDRLAKETRGRVVSSIYFGGGTPSLMEVSTVSAIMDAIRKNWSLRNTVEVTLEANPSSVESSRFKGYRDAGVNRVSMGFQALNDRDLAKLGRLHNTATALRALDVAKSVFDRVNFDLIYARQDQTLLAWEQELAVALAFAPSHLSLYQLTVEDGTAFAQRFAAGGLRGLPEEDLAADMYLLTQSLCDAAGLPAYEVSNHASAGAESQHNLSYWRGDDYVGLGPGAHGRLTIDAKRVATLCPKDPAVWLDQVTKLGFGEDPRTVLSSLEWAEEAVLMGLRTKEGLDLERLTAIRGRALNPSALDNLLQIGMLRLHEGRAIATPQGILVLNAVIREVTAGLAE